MKRKDIPALTSLRFPAAFAIVLFHYLTLTTFPSWRFENLSMGVSFFYILSGFILYYNYSDLENRGLFWIARVARIWPVHLVTCGLILSILPFNYILGHEHWPYTLSLNLLLLQAWVPLKGSVLSFNGVAWSLSVEAFFYFSFPWLLAMLKRFGIWAMFLGSFLLGLVAVSLAQLLLPHQPDFGSYFPVCRLFEFVLGMVTCSFWLEHSSPLPNYRLWSTHEIGSLAIAVLGALLVEPLVKHVLELSRIANWIMSLLPALCFSMVMWVFAHQAGVLSRLFASKVTVQLGEVSFSLYMCHQIVLRFLTIRTGIANVQWEVLFTVYLVFSLSLAYLLFYWVETPARHWIVDAYRSHVAAKNSGKNLIKS